MRSLNEVRDALLDSTVRIAARHGLERTTTKLIAADAQINEAYIYRCYDNKDALLQAAFHNEDVRFAAHVRKSLSVMQIQGLSWKESCFLLWKSCWKFVLHNPDDCRFYLQYYYSTGCRQHAYEEHLRFFHAMYDDIRPVFLPDTNVDILLHQIFDTMLSFAARVMSGEMEDNEETVKWTFEQVYSFVRPNAREEWVETAKQEKDSE